MAAAVATDDFPNESVAPAADLDVRFGGEDLAEVIYVDHYGNCFTGMRARGLAGRRSASPRAAASSRTRACSRRSEPGTAFWYENSSGLVEIAVNRGSAARGPRPRRRDRRSPGRPCMLFTIGHSNRPIDELLEMLRAAGVERLVDVRAVPKSRRWPQYDGEALERSLAAEGIEYAWRGDALGGFRKPAPSSPHVALDGAFRGFADHMATPAFAAAVADLLASAEGTPTAIMCAEKRPAECHRSLITDYVLACGVEVVHLIAPERREPARLNAAARAVPGGLVYDGGGQQRLL